MIPIGPLGSSHAHLRSKDLGRHGAEVSSESKLRDRMHPS